MSKFQADTAEWLLRFGERVPEAFDKQERVRRFFEEAVELSQSCGMSAEDAVQILSYVFSKEPGHTGQEIGGVMTTLAALCERFGYDCFGEGRRELDRISRPEVMDKIVEKQRIKKQESI